MQGPASIPGQSSEGLRSHVLALDLPPMPVHAGLPAEDHVSKHESHVYLSLMRNMFAPFQGLHLAQRWL